MARVQYSDGDSGRRGEMDLNELREGDVVRFLTRFEDGKNVVDEGALGEVVEAHPQLPRIGVRVYGIMNSNRGKDFSRGVLELAVHPKTVIVLVDSRDDRVGPGCITEVGEQDLSPTV